MAFELVKDPNDIDLITGSRLISINNFYSLDLITGSLSSFFQGNSSDGYVGLAYSPNAGPDDLFAYDVQHYDDIYVYDGTQARNALYLDIISQFNAGRGDLAAPVPIPGAILLFGSGVAGLTIARRRWSKRQV